MAVKRQKELPISNVPQLETRFQRRSDDVFHYNRMYKIHALHALSDGTKTRVPSGHLFFLTIQ